MSVLSIVERNRRKLPLFVSRGSLRHTSLKLLTYQGSKLHQKLINNRLDKHLNQFSSIMTELFLLTNVLLFTSNTYNGGLKKESIYKYNIDIKQVCSLPFDSSPTPFQKVSSFNRGDEVFRFCNPNISILPHMVHQLWSTNNNFCGKKIFCTCIFFQVRRRELPENVLDFYDLRPAEHGKFQPSCENGFRNRNKYIFFHITFLLRNTRNIVSNNRSWCICILCVIRPRYPYPCCRTEGSQVYQAIFLNLNGFGMPPSRHLNQ